jgi:hypothetical protein
MESMKSPQRVHEHLVQSAHGVLMECSWNAHGLLMECSWTAHGVHGNPWGTVKYSRFAASPWRLLQIGMFWK